MNMPCIVELDLNRYLRQEEDNEAQEARIEELAEERYRYLTADRPGVTLITESLCIDESGYPLDEALFALLSAWRSSKDIKEATANLVILLRKKAEQMARQWAKWEAQREKNQAQMFEEDVPW